MKVPECVFSTAEVQGDNADFTCTGVDIGNGAPLPAMRMLTLQCHRLPGGGGRLQSASGVARLLACWGV
jgi:hypothetical protein